MSMYAGETAGLQMRMRVNDQAAEDQLKREAIDAGLKREAMGNQARMFAAQQANQGAMDQPAARQGGMPERQAAEPRASHSPKDVDSLTGYIHGVTMGNPLEAEKGFGMAQPGTTRRNADGSISFTSTEGHPVTIPSDRVDAVVGGYRNRAPKAEMDPLKTAGLELKNQLIGKQIAKLDREPSLTPAQKAQQAKDDRIYRNKVEDDLIKAQGEAALHAKFYDQVARAGGELKDKNGNVTATTGTASLALQAAKAAVARHEKRLQDFDANGADSSLGVPTPTTPAAAPLAQPAPQPNQQFGLRPQDVQGPEGKGYILSSNGGGVAIRNREINPIQTSASQPPANDANKNGIDDADEQAMVWASANKATNPIKAKAVMDKVKAKYPKIYGEQ